MFEYCFTFSFAKLYLNEWEVTLSHWKREVVIKSIYGSKSVEEKETKQTKRELYLYTNRM